MKKKQSNIEKLNLIEKKIKELLEENESLREENKSLKRNKKN